MILYLSIIIIATIAIAVCNILFNPVAMDWAWYWVAIGTVLSTIAEIGIDGLFAALIHAIPDKHFDPSKKCFTVGKRERRFYEKIGVKSWKEKVWELGALGGFRKNKIADPNNPDYLHKFLVEANKGFVIHVADCIVGFLVIFILPLKFAWTIGVPVALVGLFLNALPAMILRYNTPKLKVAYERARRLEERAKKEKVEETK